MCVGARAAAAEADAAPGDILAANLDWSVDQAVDFFTYANGGWLKSHPIPPSEANWGIGKVVQEELYDRLKHINEAAAAAKAAKGSDTQKIGDFWATAMDTNKATRLGLEPLRAELARIDAVRTLDDAVNVSIALRPVGIHPFFGVGVGQDQRRSDVMAVQLGQGGLGLPERDFYFNPEKGVARIRREYEAHLARLLRLAGRPEADAAAAAHRVMAFETKLARVSRKLQDLRDPEKNYNKMSPDDLTRRFTPHLPWTRLLGEFGLKPETVIVGQPEFFAGLEKLLRRTPVATLKDYLRLQVLDGYAEYLGGEWDKENFAFNHRVLAGQKEQRPQWKRALDAQEQAMGMVLGRIFVAEYFPPEAKKRYADLVEAVRLAYFERIDRLDWMGAETKAKAREKLKAITSKVGYPDKWKDYSTMAIGAESYAGNIMAAARWHFQDMLSKYGKPVDRTEWTMTPQTYNAYYEPANNEIVLPAAIFSVPGMRDADLDDALVYGYAAASTIGHEITHGFDDEGRKFDAKGNLTNWWTAADEAQFQKRAAVLAAQFSGYEPIPGLHINGAASLGENLADYGGLLLGLDAFKKTSQFKEGKPMGGFTPIQRYFLGYALGWMTQQREELLRQHLLSDVHAPAKWRVLGPLSNIPDFHAAFGVTPGKPMYRPPEAQVKVW
jgi:putative endopeptidase